MKFSVEKLVSFKKISQCFPYLMAKNAILQMFWAAIFMRSSKFE